MVVQIICLGGKDYFDALCVMLSLVAHEIQRKNKERGGSFQSLRCLLWKLRAVQMFGCVHEHQQAEDFCSLFPLSLSLSFVHSPVLSCIFTLSLFFHAHSCIFIFLSVFSFFIFLVYIFSSICLSCLSLSLSLSLDPCFYLICTLSNKRERERERLMQ
jgi:hypothetical protein